MEITLEQIELVKDRTGVSYKEAKEALEASNGNVVDAIIYIEESMDKGSEKADASSADKLIATIKDVVRKGNVTKIRVFKGDELILNVPANVGALATLVFPWGVVAAAAASAATKCKVELVKEDGTVVDVNEKATTVVETVKDKSGVIVDELKVKSVDLYNNAKEKGTVLGKEAVVKGNELYKGAVEKGSELYKGAVEKGKELYESTKDKVAEYLEKSGEERIMDISDLDLEEETKMDCCESSCDDCCDTEQ